MRYQSLYKLTATSQGILLNGSAINKQSLNSLDPQLVGYVQCASQLLKKVTPEEWDRRTPHDSRNIPTLAKVNMLLALASPQALDKYNFNPDEPRDERGRWVDTDGDGGEQEARLAGYEPVSYVSSHPMTHKDYVKRKQDFVDAHLAATEKAAKTLHVPVENILGLSALESTWGTSDIAQNANNFFGLHYSSKLDDNEPYINAQGVKMSQYDNYDESLQAFVERKGNLIYGVSDPVKFATIIQNDGKFGINTDTGENVSDYVNRLVTTIKSVPSVMARTRIKI